MVSICCVGGIAALLRRTWWCRFVASGVLVSMCSVEPFVGVRSEQAVAPDSLRKLRWWCRFVASNEVARICCVESGVVG